MSDQNTFSTLVVEAGNVRVECKSSEEFLANELARLVQDILNSVPEDAFSEVNDEGTFAAEGRTISDLDFTTNTIAGFLGAKSGPDLVLAAIAQIQLVKQKDKAGRSEILSEMKKAPTYYKSTYGKNLTSYLNSLMKSDKINLVSENTYALRASTRSEIEKVLANE